MRLLVPLLLTALPLWAAPAPFLNPARRASPESEMKALEGEWVRVSLTVDGEADPDVRGYTAVIAEGRMSLRRDGRHSDFILAIRPSASPKAFDLTMPVGDDPPEMIVLRGIYRLAGDKATFCYTTTPDGPRPTSFKGGEGVSVDTYRRKRP